MMVMLAGTIRRVDMCQPAWSTKRMAWAAGATVQSPDDLKTDPADLRRLGADDGLGLRETGFPRAETDGPKSAPGGKSLRGDRTAYARRSPRTGSASHCDCALPEEGDRIPTPEAREQAISAHKKWRNLSLEPRGLPRLRRLPARRHRQEEPTVSDWDPARNQRPDGSTIS